MGEVVDFNGTTVMPMAPEKILTAAIEEDLEYALVLGWSKDQSLYVASSTSEVATAIHALELAKLALLQQHGE